MPLTPEQAIARVPFLAKAQDSTITPLAGGITNSNYRIDADGQSYVLRITGGHGTAGHPPRSSMPPTWKPASWALL
jgi:Ser/Thr protein kinase RdoA (MazF antagonist)